MLLKNYTNLTLFPGWRHNQLFLMIPNVLASFHEPATISKIPIIVFVFITSAHLFDAAKL